MKSCSSLTFDLKSFMVHRTTNSLIGLERYFCQKIFNRYLYHRVLTINGIQTSCAANKSPKSSIGPLRQFGLCLTCPKGLELLFTFLLFQRQISQRESMSISYERFPDRVRSRFSHFFGQVGKYFIYTNVVLGRGFKK